MARAKNYGMTDSSFAPACPPASKVAWDARLIEQLCNRPNNRGYNIRSKKAADGEVTVYVDIADIGPAGIVRWTVSLPTIIRGKFCGTLNDFLRLELEAEVQQHEVAG